MIKSIFPDFTGNSHWKNDIDFSSNDCVFQQFSSNLHQIFFHFFIPQKNYWKKIEWNPKLEMTTLKNTLHSYFMNVHSTFIKERT